MLPNTVTANSSSYTVCCFLSMTVEQLFQQMLLKKLRSEAEHLAQLVGADVQELYKVVTHCIITCTFMMVNVCRWRLRIVLSTMTLIMPCSIACILKYWDTESVACILIAVYLFSAHLWLPWRCLLSTTR